MTSAFSIRARTGKIARLPRPIREQLNRRLDDGEPRTLLMEWLNELPAVREVLDRDFGGRPVTEGNLFEWWVGGFQDWRKAQWAEGWACALVHEAQTLGETASTASLANHLATIVALEIGRLLRDGSLEIEPPEPEERRKKVLAIAGALGNLQRVQIEAEHARIKSERWEAEQKRQEQEERRRKEEEDRAMPKKLLLQAIEETALIEDLLANRAPAQAASLRAYYEDLRKRYRPEHRRDDPSPGVISCPIDPTQFDLIRPSST